MHPLHDRLAGAHDDLSQTLRDQLQRSPAPHYRATEHERLDGWCSRLLDELVDAAGGNPGRLARHAEKVARERLEDGFELRELQLALSVLEREAWKLCVERVADREELIAELAQLTTVIGMAKDTVARVYLEAAERARDHSALLQRRLDQLAKGTDEVAPDREFF